jgi:hypothetical protein
MAYDRDKVDDATLALMWLTMWKERAECAARAWKGFDWETLDRLHEKGLIDDPKGKARSVFVTDEGFTRAKALFARMFGEEEEKGEEEH